MLEFSISLHAKTYNTSFLLLDILVIIESYNVISSELNMTIPYISCLLTHFTQMFHFCTPWKRPKLDIGAKRVKLLVMEKLMVKESHYLIDWDHFGVSLESKNSARHRVCTEKWHAIKKSVQITWRQSKLKFFENTLEMPFRYLSSSPFVQDTWKNKWSNPRKVMDYDLVKRQAT